MKFGEEVIVENAQLSAEIYATRPANYSDTEPGPKTRPNVVIRIFELSLYFAEHRALVGSSQFVGTELEVNSLLRIAFPSLTTQRIWPHTALPAIALRLPAKKPCTARFRPPGGLPR